MRSQGFVASISIFAALLCVACNYSPQPTPTPAAQSPSETGHEPSGSQNSSAAPVSEFLPWDGGEYIWASSGIRMRTELAVVEPWPKSEFYEEIPSGSTKVALKYTIKVPRGFSGRFDPTLSCPGILQVTNGSDEDAIFTVSDDDRKDLDGVVLPGTTKFGVATWAISPKYRNSEFVMESGCGDIDLGGDFAYFGGKFPLDTSQQLKNAGKTTKTRHFAVTVKNVRQSGANYDVSVEVCVRRIPSGFDFVVPVSVAPWSVTTAGGRTVKPAKGGTFKSSELDKDSCASGSIRFKASSVKKINYANSLGERATWS